LLRPAILMEHVSAGARSAETLGRDAIVVTNERFEQGMTARQYLDQMSTNREPFLAALTATTITPEDTALLQRLAVTRRILVLTEDWCGAALASVPFVFKLVEETETPRIEIRIFLRDENPDLMDQFLKGGLYRSIPVFAFFDEHMNELARFIERRPA
jgi:Thioredoxin